MFGFGKGKKIKQDPRKLAALTDEQLYLFFTDDNWTRLDKPSRLAVLQEVENRRAKLDGRRPFPVVSGEGREFDDPALRGGFDFSEKVIRISHLDLDDNSGFLHPEDTLDTVLHEGRHGMQFLAVTEGIGDAPDAVKLEWLGNNVRYFRPPQGEVQTAEDAVQWTLYAMQSNEIDARRFARVEIERARDAMAAAGGDTRALDAQLQRSYQEEFALIFYLQNLFNDEAIDQVEQDVIGALEPFFPGISQWGVRFFDHARRILRSPKVDNVDDAIPLIRELDAYEADRLKGVDDRLAAKLDGEARDRLAEEVARIRGNRL